MTSPGDPIVIGDDGDVEDLLNSQRSRSLSVSPSASSTAIRAESLEPEIVPELERLSMEPQPFAQLSRNRTSKNILIMEVSPSPQPPRNLTLNVNRRRRRSIELDEGDGPRQRRRLSTDHRVSRIFIDVEEEDAKIRSYNKDDDEIIDIDELELKLEDEIFQELQPPRGRKSGQRTLEVVHRNSPLVLPFAEVDIYKWTGASLKAGKTVELSDGSFLKISTIIKNLQTDEIRLRGWKLKRAREMDGIVPKKINEVTFIFEVDLNDRRHYLEQSIVEVLRKDIFRIRKLICTNRPFPECRFDQNYLQGKTKKDTIDYIENREVLVARWKLTTKFDNDRDRLENPNKPNNYRQRQLESLSTDECTFGYAMPVSLRRLLWRGDTILGGSGTKRTEVKSERRGGVKKFRSGPTFIILLDDDDEDGPNKENIANIRQHSDSAPKQEQVYTYGDTFSGGGGSMRGASMAGLKLMYGLDFNSDGCSTLRANFPDIKVFEKWAHEFVALPDPLKKLLVDILHLSPPCQVFSPIHTRAGKDDEMNFASLFAVEELIKKTRPRMVTLEQTFGILHNRFSSAFNSLIKMFTDSGFSTSWQVVEFHKFGLAQSRKRLIIVAAGPGETVPEFPAYTHNENGSNGLKKYTSVRKVLGDIPRNASQHDKQAAMGRAIYHPWDDSSIIRCITTNGGDYNCHPSGKRGLTYRELAALQGFPHEHSFTGNSAKVIKRQIGNAVPPGIAQIIFERIRKHLWKVDKTEMRGFGIVEGR